eukprot:6480485-Karenia_brevis.AAC.1
MLPSKGISNWHGVRIMTDEVKRSARAKFTYRSDGEPAIVALKRENAKICRESFGMEADLEETSIGDSGANGLAEIS